MREQHNRRRHPVPELLQRRPCELFVPRVKESRLCSVCGFTLIDHNVEPIRIDTSNRGGSLSFRSRNYSIGLQHSQSVDGAIGHQENSNTVREFKLLNGLLIPQDSVENYSSRTMDSHLTPSLNSAFSRYERTPSRDSIAVSDFSLSPVSFKSEFFYRI